MRSETSTVAYEEDGMSMPNDATWLLERRALNRP